MDFRLPDDHASLGELARTILSEHAAPERHTRLEADGWMDRELWAALAGSGLIGIALPSDVGGGGMDALATHVLLREVGANAAHVPLYETTILGARVVDRCGTEALRHQVLGSVVAGSMVLTAALHDEDGNDPLRPTTAAEVLGDGEDRAVVLTGVKAAVPAAPLADRIVVPATTADGVIVLALVPVGADGLTVEEQRMPTDVPHGQVVLAGVRVAGADVLAVGDEAEAALVDLVEHARAGIASMQAGLVEAAVAMAAQHTSTREQFGRAIATFQAVRQRVADARIASEMLSLTSLQAAWMLAEGQSAADEVLIAKWWAGEAGHVALHAVHHVHGGIGVDREYPLHRLFGRAKSHEFALGTTSQLLGDLGARLAAAPVDEAAA